MTGSGAGRVVGLVAGGLALAAVSCSDEGPSSGNRWGEMHNATFSWRCSDGNDLYCEGDPRYVFPQAVAVEGEFDLWFYLRSELSDRLHEGDLELAGPEGPLLQLTAGFRGDDVGEGAIIALTSRGEVADFLWLDVQRVDRLDVVHRCDAYWDEYEYDPAYDSGDYCGPDGHHQRQEGERLDLRVEPISDGGLRLGGDLDYSWSVEPSHLVSSWAGGNTFSLEALEPGEVEIVVSAVGIEQRVTLTITRNDEPIPTPDPPIDPSGPSRTRPDKDDGTTGGSGGESTGGSGGETEGGSETGTGTRGGMQ